MRRLVSFKFRVPIYFLFVALGAWAFYFEPSYFQIKSYKLAIPELRFSKPYRIAVVADLHVGSAYYSLDRLDSIVDAVNSVNADLILIVGDLVAHHKGRGAYIPPEDIAKKLSRLSASDGVFGVLGNHDWWLDSVAVTKAMESNGIPMLDEKSIRVKEKFHLMGIGDFLEGHPDPETNAKSITDNLPIIAMTHNPDIFPRVPKKIALTIAGHTHGGQVYFPILGRLIVPSKYGSRYAIGHIFESGHHLFVSTGVGTSILPVRFLVPPEVSILEIN